MNTVLEIQSGLPKPDMSMDFKKKVFDFVRATTPKITMDDITEENYQKYLVYWDDILTKVRFLTKNGLL